MAVALDLSDTTIINPPARLIADDYTVAINTTATPTTLPQQVNRQARPYLLLYAKGNNASCSAAITFRFQVSPDNTNWFDAKDQFGDDVTIAVNLNGTTAVQSAVPLDLRGMPYWRLYSVQNAETTSGYTATVNAWLVHTRGGLA